MTDAQRMAKWRARHAKKLKRKTPRPQREFTREEFMAMSARGLDEMMKRGWWNGELESCQRL
jgi:hypothetical protein